LTHPAPDGGFFGRREHMTKTEKFGADRPGTRREEVFCAALNSEMKISAGKTADQVRQRTAPAWVGRQFKQGRTAVGQAYIARTERMTSGTMG